MPFYYTKVEKSRNPVRIRMTAILNFKKPKTVPEFEPGWPRKNDIALPFVPPLPCSRNVSVGFLSLALRGTCSLEYWMAQSNPKKTVAAYQ